jgi:peroxiredoxin
MGRVETMSENSGEKRLFLGWSSKAWSIIGISAIAAFVVVMGCGLVLGLGAFSTYYLLNYDSANAAALDLPSAEEAAPVEIGAEQAPAEQAPAEQAPAEQAPAEEVKLGIHPDTAHPPKTGNPATDFTLKDLEGNLVTLSDYKGRPILINFWATWCGPCEAEMPEIDIAYQKYKDDGLVVLAIDLEEHPETVKSFVNYYELTFTILLDREHDVGSQYGTRALPTSFFIDPSGNIAYVHFGQMRERDIEIGLSKIMPNIDLED